MLPTPSTHSALLSFVLATQAPPTIYCANAPRLSTAAFGGVLAGKRSLYRPRPWPTTSPSALLYVRTAPPQQTEAAAPYDGTSTCSVTRLPRALRAPTSSTISTSVCETTFCPQFEKTTKATSKTTQTPTTITTTSQNNFSATLLLLTKDPLDLKHATRASPHSPPFVPTKPLPKNQITEPSTQQPP